jgi:hypothetical protein
MRPPFKWMSIFGMVFATHGTALAQSAAPPIVPPAWPVSSAPARFVIEDEPTGKPNLLSSVSLCLPDPKWASMPMRVFTDAGTAVGSQLLWSAPGEPATLLYDSSSGSKHYDVYLGSTWPPLPLDNTRAGVLLESRPGNGASVDTLPQMFQAWNQSTTINGRAMVPGIFEGGNRFGPEANTLEHFQGWFDAVNPEHLELALISNDASFVLVDGKEVAEWPGHHDFREGLSGAHQGAIDLQPGVHMLEYYNAFNASPPWRPILCCLAVKGGALAQWVMLTPNVPFLRPMGHAHVVNYETQADSPAGAQGSSAPAFAMDWSIVGQCVVDPLIANLGLISVQLTCLPSTTGTLTWTFDDGTTATGPSVTHLFPRPGMRVVQLSVQGGDKNSGIERQTINVHPNWVLLNTIKPALIPAYEADILSRDPMSLSGSDLAGCVAVFLAFKDTAGLSKILPGVCAKIDQISDSDLVYVKDAALFLADDLSHAADASQLLQALIARCAVSTASPELQAYAQSARLALGELILCTSDHIDAVRSILKTFDADAPSKSQGYGGDMLEGDLDFATGDISGARKLYQFHTYAPTGPDARSSVRRTGLIGQARAFIERKDFESAQRSLLEVLANAAIEKLAPDWQLTQLRLYQEENLPQVAYLYGKRLLAAITGSDRSELLFRVTELAFAQGDTDLAHQTLSELLKKHPYSSEAAQAKEKWPGQA